MTTPDVYDFDNYRDYLQNHYSSAKASGMNFTYGKFSERAGIKSPNLLKLVIDGKKNLTTETIIKFAKALQLNSQEADYFEALVLENQAKSELERRHFRRKMKNLKPRQLSGRIRVDPSLGLFNSPTLPAVLILMAGEKAEAVSAKLQEQLGISEDKSHRLLLNLEQQGIALNQEGIFQINFKHGIFHRDTANMQLKSYLKSHLSITEKAFSKHYDKSAKFFSHSMGVDPSRFEEFIDDVDKFIADMNIKYDVERAQKVLQLNAQCFWLDPTLLR